MKKKFLLFALLLLTLLIFIACQRKMPTCEEHSFGEWTVTQEPTCQKEGVKTRVCTVCQYHEEQKTALGSHKMKVGDTIVPTVTEIGYSVKTCTVCEKEEKFAYKPPTGTVGLIYGSPWDCLCYSIKGIEDTCTDEIIYIPYLHNGRGILGFEEGAFKNCTNIKKIVYLQPSADSPFAADPTLFKLEEIYKEAFSGCTSLESVDLGTSIKEIQDSAFKGCTALTEISFGGSVERIGDSAFENCTSLEAFPHLRKLERVGTAAFKNCTSLKEFFVCRSVTFVGAQALAGCTELRSLQLEETENWQYGLSEDATQWTDVNPNDLKNVAIAATQYLENYYQVCFKQKTT